MAEAKGIGLINTSPFATGLLTDRGPPDWHPADAPQRAVFKKAADFCQEQKVDISRLALQFASQHPEILTTLFSSANPDSVRRNVAWHGRPADPELLRRVQEILSPVRDLQWTY